MEITFLGGAGTVTGSRYLVTAGGRSVLVDCGLFQGLKQLRLRNREPFPVPPASIDAVVLTHAHLDHTGYLPLLVREGFRGRAYCTPATRDLCGVLLPDSGHLQEEEARFAAEHGYSRHHPPLPLYTRADAERSLESLQGTAFGEEVELGAGLRFCFRPAGHMLGAGTVTLTDGRTTLAFSGDLGRPHDPLLPPPAPLPGADFLVLESTYGDRLHDPGSPEDRLGEVVRRTASRGGVVLIPAFAVGRAQAVLFHLHRLRTGGRIPDIPVYLDSPMATAATRVFRAHAGELRLTPDECDAVCRTAETTESVEESKRIDRMHVPRVIISASGMATGGRVLHHLKVFAPDPANTILFAGYQAAGTRGADLVAGARSVKIHGRHVPVRAEVAALENVSAHADYAEILDWLGRMEGAPREVFVTHGEPVASDALRRRIQDRFGWSCRVPEHRERVGLG
jgi:metallo-beta-lactamase family protein